MVFCLCASLGAQPAPPAPSAADGGRIEGRVRDASGLGVARASAVLRNALSGWSRSGETNDAGEFSFADLPEGRYSLSFSAPALSNETRVVDLRRPWRVQVVEAELGLARMDQQITVVSGSRVEELQADSPVKVEALTREQIRDTGYERVSDVLSEIPGVVVRSGSSGTVGAEQIQGVDSRQVLVLQDGLPVVGARGVKSGSLNLNRQNVGKLERVEVAKGAASALYGSDAIGGVINMITREPAEPFSLGLAMSGGSLGAMDGRVDLGARWKKLTFFTDLEHHRQDAYGLIPGNPGTVGPDLARNDVLTRLRYAWSERATVGFSATAYHNHQTGLTNSSVGLTLGTSNDSSQMYAVTGDFVLTPATTLQARAYAARYDENSKTDLAGTNTPSYGFANLNERYHRLDATLSRQLGARQLLQGGAEWAQDLYRGANRLVGDNAGQQATTNDVWLQDRLQPTRKLTVTLGGRYQRHSRYGDHMVPKAGAVYRLTERWIARASFGQGFRAPDLGQLYYRFANPSSFYQVIGNPTLRPETSASFSAGAAYQQRRWQVGLNLYRNQLNNLIDTYSLGTPQTPDQLAALLAPYGVPVSFSPLANRLTYIYLNLNRARTQGVEVNGAVAVNRRIGVSGAYTFLDAVDRATGLALPQRHRHQGYVKADYSNPRWGVLANVRGSFFSRWPLNPSTGTFGYGYQMWDAYLSKRLARGLQAFASIDNLADSRDRKLALATPTFDRPDYGRTWRIGLRWRLGGE
ncbi:MAG: TonB-dependent receptor [Acidobacteria bacterium]|nr:TonB-dependent receptor [Acidobacteriota bacterium]